jgi:hypothetical protein
LNEYSELQATRRFSSFRPTPSRWIGDFCNLLPKREYPLIQPANALAFQRG